MKGGESGMEQTEILLAIQQQLTMLQSTVDTLREQSRQKDEEIERIRQIILNLQRAQFGQRSEKWTYVLDDGTQQISMFDTQSEQAETETVPSSEHPQSPEKEIASLVTAGRISARWKSSARRCLWKRESWICRMMKR